MLPEGKKPPNAGKGRKPGVPNKTTNAARTAISTFIDGKAAEVEALWVRVASRDPAKAVELYAKLAEFVLPKLSRSTVDGELGIRGKLVIRDWPGDRPGVQLLERPDNQALQRVPGIHPWADG